MTPIKCMALAALVLAALVVAAAGETLIFSDDFNDFNLGTWEHEITMGGGGNWEFEYYTNNRSNSYTKNGLLFLKPTLTADVIGEANVKTGYRMDLWGSNAATMCTGNAFYGCERTSGAGGNYLNPIQSARLRTSSSLNFKYGRVEIRAKLPKGDWIWPAIWMLPRYNQYGTWPASGEIDIMESRGNVNYPSGGTDSFGSTLHFGPFFPEDPYNLTHKEYKLPSGTFADAFHTFGLYWDANGIYTYVDAPTNKVLEVNWSTQSFWQRGGWDKRSGLDNPWLGRGPGAPFDREFYLVMNVAVGGVAGYFPDGEGGKPWTNHDDHAVNKFYDAKAQWYPTWKGEDAAMQVDWVKVWKL